MKCECGGVIYADTENWHKPLCYECYIKPEPMDMSGDRVFSLIVTELNLDGYDLYGATISEPTTTHKNRARKLIKIHLNHQKTGQKVVKSYNYNKILRHLRKQDRINP